jgi:hypothetical protein
MSPSAPGANGNGAMPNQPDANYEISVDLNEITRRQLNEDIKAYRYDLDFCTAQLQVPDLTAQETRTIQLRILDLGHQIRHCQHRVETIEAQARQAAMGANNRSMFYFDGVPKRRSTGTPAPLSKRSKISSLPGVDDSEGTAFEVDYQDGSSVQRLGYWMCRLCTAPKYLSAGPNRVPSAPCKWPLRDVSKMLNHYLDMHTEHDPEERCMELGAALTANRKLSLTTFFLASLLTLMPAGGPFEYWLTRTKTQNLSEGNIMDDCINTLLSGGLPNALRKLNKAAGAFPNAQSGTIIRKEKQEYLAAD